MCVTPNSGIFNFGSSASLEEQHCNLALIIVFDCEPCLISVSYHRVLQITDSNVSPVASGSSDGYQLIECWARRSRVQVRLDSRRVRGCWQASPRTILVADAFEMTGLLALGTGDVHHAAESKMSSGLAQRADSFGACPNVVAPECRTCHL